ncbi:MAG: hypothetical protein ABIT01_18330, partial [Thermoanaerobaculia bacterium]
MELPSESDPAAAADAQGSLRTRLVSAGLSGLLLSLCFPNSSLVALLPVALVPLMAAIQGARVRAAALAGTVFALSFWILTIPWIAYTVHRYGGVPWWAAAIALVVTALIMVPPFGLMTALVAALAPRSVLALLFVWPAAWIAQEGFRTYIYVFGGFPWALVAYPLAERPAWIQTASLGGVWLTSGLVILVNALFFCAVRSRVRRTRVALGLAALLLMGSVFSYGVWRMHAFKQLAAATPWVSVGVLQPNVSQDERWTAEARRVIYDDLVARTRTVARELKGTTRLILWPESASPYQWSWSPELRDSVVALCRELDVAIVLSTAWSDTPESDEAPIYNAAVLVTSAGPVLPPYFKLRLV